MRTQPWSFDLTILPIIIRPQSFLCCPEAFSKCFFIIFFYNNKSLEAFFCITGSIHVCFGVYFFLAHRIYLFFSFFITYNYLTQTLCWKLLQAQKLSLLFHFQWTRSSISNISESVLLFIYFSSDPEAFPSLLDPSSFSISIDRINFYLLPKLL